MLSLRNGTFALNMKDLQLGLDTVKNEMVQYQYHGTNEMIKGFNVTVTGPPTQFLATF